LESGKIKTKNDMGKEHLAVNCKRAISRDNSVVNEFGRGVVVGMNYFKLWLQRL